MKQKIIFLLSHQPNPRFIKQINFLAKSRDVHVLHFKRACLKDLPESLYAKNVNIECLFKIKNLTAYTIFNRFFQYVKSIKRLNQIFRDNNFKIIIFNNIDMYVLFAVSTIFKKIDITKIIEISDLIYLHEKNNLISKIFKFLEKIFFKKIDKAIFTSPKFFTEYYKNIFNGDYFILENKPLSNAMPNIESHKKNDNIVIGIVGLLLQLETYQYLFEFVKNNDSYKVHVHGKGLYEKEINEYAKNNKNIEFFGEYNFFEDSSNIYSSLDIIYMPYSLKIQSLNNKLALPNKLYEAMYFKVPIITSRHTFLGEIVKKYGIGQQIDYSDKTEIKNAIELIVRNKKTFRNNFNKIDRDVYIADKDYNNLSIFLGLE